MATKILVSGATGNVGAEVARALQKSQVPFRAADLDPDAIHQRLGEDVEAVTFNFSDPLTYPAAFAGIERMFLMRPPQMADVKKLMFPALEAAAAAGVKHFVFLSLINIEKISQAPHYQVELRLRALKVDYTFLRCSFFMQNLNTTHREEIRIRNEIFVPVGKARTSFLDVRDIGAVAARILCEDGHAGKAYDLTGGEALDYYQVAELFSSILGRKITYTNPTAIEYVAKLVTSGTPLPFAMITAWLYGNTKKGMADIITGEVERLLGRKPITLAQYIQDYRASWD